MVRRTFLMTALGSAALPALMAAPPFDPAKDLIAAPDDPAQWPAFREALAAWRRAAVRRLDYDGALYLRQEFSWVPSCFSCCFLMLCDETFYDRASGRYNEGNLLSGTADHFGGFDSVVLWHAYPKIGIDDRNQFDYYRDMPGGLEGLRRLSNRLHRGGVRVFLDYLPWDIGTRREGTSDLEALAALVEAIDADGIFLDTMSKGSEAFRARLDAARPGVVLEGEGALPLENVHDHHMSWAQWFTDSRVPGILRNKWFERRHMQHQIKRWDRDHTAELHTAWMNGSGMMVWENVFGSLVSWSPRDSSILRSMLPIQRRYAVLFAGENWTPLVPTEKKDVFGSLWEGDGLRLWTLVNRAEETAQGTLLRAESRSGDRYFDLIAGREIEGHALRGAIRPRGIGAFLSGTTESLGSDLFGFLAGQMKTDLRASFITATPSRPMRLVPVTRVAPQDRKAPPGMVQIPAARVRLEVEFRIRECGFYESDPGPAVVHNLHRPVVFERDAELSDYAIDLTPVTNAQYLFFLKASGYRPRHRENFLEHWRKGAPPPGLEDHPVVYVDLDDARAYAKWAGKRLPTEEEWQYAAQGSDKRRYPWGDEMLPGRANGGESGGTTSVTAFPGGRSPFGCYDMCGNTWEWTESERSDGRTRFAILRGGSYYKAEGSEWYTDGGPQPCNFALKFLLMWPGLDRCATIGFRCAVDLT